jgi:hypothetical protein
MQLTIQGANTAGLTLDLPLSGANYSVALGPTTGLEATAELVGSEVVVHSLEVAQQTILAGSWSLPGVGTVELTKPLVASNVKVKGRVPLGDPLALVARIEVGAAEVGGLAFNGWGIQQELSLVATGIVIEQDAARNRRLSVEKVDVSGLSATHEIAKAQIARVILQGLGVELSSSGALGAQIAALAVSELRANALDVDLHVERVAIDQIGINGQDASVGSIAVGSVGLAASNLPIPDPFAPSAQPKPTGPVKFEPPDLPDVPFLDDLQGIFNMDLTVDLAIPILKSRKATHRIKMDLIDGTFDFKVVEHGLSGLEDAVIDFEVKPGKLILEKDIPLIPFDNTTLVWWPLDPDEHQNAKKNKRVRLRRMLDFNLTDFVTSKLEAALNSQGGSSFFKVALNTLCIDNLECDVELGGPSRFDFEPFVSVTLGSEQRKAVKKLRMTGAVHFAPEADLDPTEVTVELQDACLGLEKLEVLGYQASIGEIGVGAVTGMRIQFNEILPDTVQGTITDVVLSNVRVGGWQLPPLKF